MARRLAFLTTVFLILSGGPVLGTDVDGPDPAQDRHDFGDAPDCSPAYSDGTIGRFPSSLCVACEGQGSQELASGCPPRSAEPGPTGAAVNSVLTDAWHVWLGCNPIDSDSWPYHGGIDDDPHPLGSPDCQDGVADHCYEDAFGMIFEQDECYSDPSDAGITTPIEIETCDLVDIPFTFTLPRGGESEIVYLNILVDFNQDGDWNDSFACELDGETVCSYEWAVKNHAYPPAGTGDPCREERTPLFRVGPNPGESWLRITLSLWPAPDDYPWNGAALQGGENEDYPILIDETVPVRKSTWGLLKSRY